MPTFRLRFRRFVIRRSLFLATRGLMGIPDLGLLIIFRRVKRLMYRAPR